jgi:hypothetical protein
LTIKWEDGPLAEALSTELSPNYSLHDSVKLPKKFNALNLEKMAGIQICWTSNLADHLSMKDDDLKVSIMFPF